MMSSNELISEVRARAMGLETCTRFLILDMCDRLERKTRDCELLRQKVAKLLPRKPMTNADHFREAISTEEGLVTFLMKAHDGEINIPFCRSDVFCKGEDDPMGEGCRACMMAYLNSPAEEG